METAAALPVHDAGAAAGAAPLPVNDAAAGSLEMDALTLPPSAVDSRVVAVVPRSAGSLENAVMELTKNVNILTPAIFSFVQAANTRLTSIEDDVGSLKRQMEEMRTAMNQPQVPVRVMMPSMREVKSVMAAAATDVKNADNLRSLCNNMAVKLLFTMMLGMDIAIPSSGMLLHHVMLVNDKVCVVFYVPYLVNLLFLFANTPLAGSAPSARDHKTLAIQNSKVWKLFVDSTTGTRGIMSATEMTKQFLLKLRNAFSDVDTDFCVDMGMGFSVQNSTLRALGVAHSKQTWFKITAELAKSSRSSSNQAAANFITLDARRLIEALVYFAQTEACHLNGSADLLRQTAVKAQIQHDVTVALQGKHVNPPSDKSQRNQSNVYRKSKDVLRREPKMRIMNMAGIKLPSEVGQDSIMNRKIQNLVTAVPLLSSVCNESLNADSDEPRFVSTMESCGKPGFAVSESWAAAWGGPWATFYQDCIQSRLASLTDAQLTALTTGNPNPLVFLDLVNSHRLESGHDRKMLTAEELQRRWTESKAKMAEKKERMRAEPEDEEAEAEEDERRPSAAPTAKRTTKKRKASAEAPRTRIRRSKPVVEEEEPEDLDLEDE